MNEYLSYVKKSSLSVSETASDSAMPMLSSPETLAKKGLLMESISTLKNLQLSLTDSRRKDQIIRDLSLESAKGSLFHRLESDIAR